MPFRGEPYVFRPFFRSLCWPSFRRHIPPHAAEAGGALLASTALPTLTLAQTATDTTSGGRLVVAADSEPKNLNPAIVASNGVFFIASKVIEPLAEASFDGKDGLSPRLATSWEARPMANR